MANDEGRAKVVNLNVSGLAMTSENKPLVPVSCINYWHYIGSIVVYNKKQFPRLVTLRVKIFMAKIRKAQYERNQLLP